MTRDDFSEGIKRTVADRVGRVCSNPDCRAATSGPQVDPAKVLNVGVAAHITAASSGGPRYDTTLTDEQRSAVENSIWLCQNCAKLVDNDSQRYPVEVLKAWKTIAEHEALHKIGKTHVPDFEAAEQSRAREMYSMAVFLLRRVCGSYFKNQNLVPYLLAKDATQVKSFSRNFDTIGRLDPNNDRFIPYTEPSSFHTDDRQVLKAAEEIVRGYVLAAKRNPDFAEIRASYDLPDPEEVMSLLPK